jgi:hypothetical protein
MPLADVTDLAGLPFMARSGNGGIVQLLGEYGLNLTWQRKPTEADMAEFHAWVEKKLGCAIDPTIFIAGRRSENPGMKRSHAAYQEFLKNATKT